MLMTINNLYFSRGHKFGDNLIFRLFAPRWVSSSAGIPSTEVPPRISTCFAWPDPLNTSVSVTMVRPVCTLHRLRPLCCPQQHQRTEGCHFLLSWRSDGLITVLPSRMIYYRNFVRPAKADVGQITQFSSSVLKFGEGWKL